MTNRVDINNLLQDMRALKAQTQAFNPAQQVRDVADNAMPNQLGPGQVNGVKPPSFGDLFNQAVDTVHQNQQRSGDLAKAYEMGDPNVDVTEVMIAAQKASVSFQAMVQVRNKLVEAYRDVMNMPI